MCRSIRQIKPAHTARAYRNENFAVGSKKAAPYTAQHGAAGVLSASAEGKRAVIGQLQTAHKEPTYKAL